MNEENIRTFLEELHLEVHTNITCSEIEKILNKMKMEKRLKLKIYSQKSGRF